MEINPLGVLVFFGGIFFFSTLMFYIAIRVIQHYREQTENKVTEFILALVLGTIVTVLMFKKIWIS